MSVHRNRELYNAYLDRLDGLASGRTPDDLKSMTNRVWNVLIGDYPVDFDASLLNGRSDYASRIATLFTTVTQHRKSHRILEVGDAHREMATERRAYDALDKSVDLLQEFFIPNGLVDTHPLNALVKDVYHLAIAYVQTVVNMAVDEYIPSSKTFDAKIKSSLLARRAFEAYASYDGTLEKLAGVTNVRLNFVRKSLEDIGNGDKLRDFVLVQVKPKDIAHKKRAITHLLETIPSDYCPDFIVPVAQGGIEDRKSVV